MQEFTIIKRGYDPEEVDKYVGKLERELDEYKEKDSAIANAILNAQIAADNIVRNANVQSEEIVSKALTHLEYIGNSIYKQKEIVKELQGEYDTLVNKYLKNIQSKDFLDVFSSINELQSYLSSITKQELEKNSPNKINNSQSLVASSYNDIPKKENGNQVAKSTVPNKETNNTTEQNQKNNSKVVVKQ